MLESSKKQQKTRSREWRTHACECTVSQKFSSKVSLTIIGVTNTFLSLSKPALQRDEEKQQRRWRGSIITSQGEVNNWSNVWEKSPSLTTKPNAKIKATHHNYKIRTDQTQSQHAVFECHHPFVSASALSGPNPQAWAFMQAFMWLKYTIQSKLPLILMGCQKAMWCPCFILPLSF